MLFIGQRLIKLAISQISVSVVVQFGFSKLLNVRLLFLTGESKNLAELLEVLSECLKSD